MKINYITKKIILNTLILVLAGFLVTANTEKNEKLPQIKKGATEVTIKGTTRSWSDVNKIPLNQRSKVRRMRPVLNFEYERPIVKKSTSRDPVIQQTYTGNTSKLNKQLKSMPDPGISFNGMSLSDNGAGWPPDTNGDVGETYFIQTVNTSIGIYKKSDGSLVSATSFNDFFEGGSITGTPCDEENNGDPIVLYDQYAQRWFILDFAWHPSETDGSYYSIAVSKTTDPTGDWWIYAFRADSTLMNDYPKAGIWHDGIYITANMFQFTGGFQGVKVWAIKKPDIYNGTLTAQSVYDTSWYAWSIMPSNAKGTTAPAANTPNYMYTFDADEWGYSPTDVLVMWKYDVDWATPANTTWTGPITIPTAAFSLHSTQIPQPGTSYTLDTLYSRLMYSAVYRNFGTHESIYLCHLADASGIAAMRWYEVRISGGFPSIFQQGSYAPDSNHRWMGSIAADKNGNIALGYSVSSSSLYPSIRYAGRLASDTTGILAQGEASMVEGTGSQNYFNRWGDYSMMTIDPSDDETFWYTQEYYSSTGTNWQTRIGSFKFTSSEPPTTTGPDFNKDGYADIVWRYYSTGGYNTVWLRNAGSAAPIMYDSPTNIPQIPPDADMNTSIQRLTEWGIKDGFSDFDYKNSQSQVNNRWITASIADPRSETGATDLNPAPNLDWKLCGTGDFNKDGNTDLIWRNTTNGLNAIWLMNGTTRTSATALPAATQLAWNLCGTGDFNSDGNTDIIWRHTGSGINSVWYMNGTTRIGIDSFPTAAILDWTLCGAADFNNDNYPDLVFRHTGDGRNVVWYMNGVNRIGIGWMPSATNLNWIMAGIEDFNNDGHPDILWQHATLGYVAIWYMNNITRVGIESLSTVTNTSWRIEN